MNQLEPELEQNLRNANLWWQNIHSPPLPPLKRWAFEPVLKRLKSGMTPIVALRGPRQVGKTTLVQQIIQHLLDEGVSATHIFWCNLRICPHLPHNRNPFYEWLTGLNSIF